MRKRTRRKVYALVNPITHAIEGACNTSDADLNKLRAMELAAIDAIARGHGSLHDLASLRDMLNIAETMANGGIGPEAIPPIEAAQTELVAMIERRQRTGRIGATGPGLEAFREAFRFHDLQRTSVHRSEYERYIKKTADILRTGGKAKVVSVDITPQ